MKGFLLALSILGVVFYFVHQSNPANRGGGGAAFVGNGSAIEITPGNFESVVVQNSAPVLAYFWAPW
ncbi:MAG: hypothetical protein R3F19_00640 [Verrucomicrobiales bacterium]